jgi:hypothetical protein
MLRLRAIRPGPVPTFLLFEGSVMAASLLVLADLVKPWGLIAIPVAVAIMVKLNDIVAGVLRRPAAIAQLDRPRLVGGPAIGVSGRPATARHTMWIPNDDAVIDPSARPMPDPTSPGGAPAGPERDGVARGIAAVPAAEDDAGPAPRKRSDGAEHRRRDRGNQGRFAS